MRRWSRARIIVLFILPACILYLLFVVYPVIRAFVVSFHHWDGYARNMTFVGLDNFRNLIFHDTVFWGSFKNTFFLLSVPGVITLGLALFFASVLSSNLRGGKFFRITFFFPNVMSMVVISLLWAFIYNPSFGILNGFLRLAGLEELTRTWLEPGRVIPALVAPIVWCSVGFYMVLFLAGIQNIPQALYEAARIDGAGSWQCFRCITLPLLWEIISIAVIFIVIGGLKVFDLVWVVTSGNPTRHSQVIATYMYQKAINEGNMGYGTAISILLFILVLVATLISMRLLAREKVEY
jgi:ABC-type sugar transport system permease subunit